MPKEEWGVKRVCPTTGKRFYDLNRSPIVSPFTGEVIEIDMPGRKSGGAASEAARGNKASAKAVEDDDLLEDDVEVEGEDNLLEEEDEDTVSFDELSDVATDGEDN